MRRKQQDGLTLVEVLVALFVLALGVVGASAAELAAQRTRQQSALISEAARLAASLAARMRANAPVSGRPDASNPYLDFSYDAQADGAPAGGASCFGPGACDPPALAAFDLHETRLAVHGRFPGGRIAVCRDAAPWDGAQQRYRWACSGGAGAPVAIKVGWHGAGDGPVLVSLAAP